MSDSAYKSRILGELEQAARETEPTAFDIIFGDVDRSNQEMGKRRAETIEGSFSDFANQLLIDNHINIITNYPLAVGALLYGFAVNSNVIEENVLQKLWDSKVHRQLLLWMVIIDVENYYRPDDDEDAPFLLPKTIYRFLQAHSEQIMAGTDQGNAQLFLTLTTDEKYSVPDHVRQLQVALLLTD